MTDSPRWAGVGCRGGAVARGGGGADRGYKRGAVYLRTGAAPALALEVLRRETARVGHALTVSQWRHAFEQDGGDGAAMLTIAHRLRSRGFVMVVGGRTRSIQYCVAALPMPVADTADLHDITFEVVSHGCAAKKEALIVGEVQAGLSARGYECTSDQVRSILTIMSTTADARAIPDQVPARLECIRQSGPFMLRESLNWRPAGSCYPAPSAPRSERVAARTAVAETMAALGWAPTAREVNAWIATNPDHPAAQSLPKGVRPAVASVLFAPIHDSGRKSGFIDVSSPMVSGGGVAGRVVVPPYEVDAVVTGRFLDTAYRLRLDEELSGIDRLREESNTLRLEGLAHLAEQRESAALFTMVEQLTLASTEWSLREIESRIARGEETTTEWWSIIKGARHAKPPRWITDVVRARSVLPEFRARLDRSERPMLLSMAGAMGMRPLDVARQWVREVLAPQGRELRSPQSLLNDVRRVPNPLRDRGPLYDETKQGFSQLDVGDLLLEVSNLTSHSRIAVLCRAAVDIMGFAVRDAAPVRRLLTELPKYERLYRSGAVIALAALGSGITPEDAMFDSCDDDGLTAYGLGIGISPMSPLERADRISALQYRVGSVLRDRVAEMYERAAGGEAIGIAM